MKTLRPPVNERDRQMGNIQSKLTLVEYGDYQCPYCRSAHSLVQRLLKEFDTELRFVFRHFPLKEVHAEAMNAAQSAEAAGNQGKFWSMHNLLFERQDRFHEKGLFLSLAEEIGLDLSRFLIDRKSEDITSKIENDFGSGIYSGVNRTPTFFLNESKIYTYDGTYDSLVASVGLYVAGDSINR